MSNVEGTSVTVQDIEPDIEPESEASKLRSLLNKFSIGSALFCDTGIHRGQYRVIMDPVYLDSDQLNLLRKVGEHVRLD